MTDRDPSAVELRAIDVVFGGTIAVRQATLTVQNKQIVSLVGPSGCGKTSLLRTIAGFETPDRGTLCINGQTVAGEGSWQPPERRRIGMVFQQGALFPHLTVQQNVEFGLRNAVNRTKRAQRVLELARLGDLRQRYPHQLSGGQQQRVALARALAPSPKVILLDEPFANLDPALRGRLREEVRTILVQARSTAILVTHDHEEALSFSDRVAVMDEGEIVQCDPPVVVYREPASPRVAQLVGGGYFLDCSANGGKTETPLGAFVVDGADGPGQLLIRPEQLQQQPGGIEATIIATRYLGHETRCDLQLRDGTRLELRHAGPVAPQRGTTLTIGTTNTPLRFFDEEGEGYSALRG